MPATRFETEIIRFRLPGYLFARYGYSGLARRATQPDSSWQETLDGADLGRYTWTTFDDDELPRAIGMRITSAIAENQTFEVVEWYAPDRVTRTHWRLKPHGRWSVYFSTPNPSERPE